MTNSSEQRAEAAKKGWDGKKQRGPHEQSGHGLDDLDRAILSVLPDEGTKRGLYLDDAPPASEIKRRLTAGLSDDEKAEVLSAISSNLIGARLGLLKTDKFVVEKKAAQAGGVKGWQRTKAGKAVAANTVAERSEA